MLMFIIHRTHGTVCAWPPYKIAIEVMRLAYMYTYWVTDGGSSLKWSLSAAKRTASRSHESRSGEKNVKNGICVRARNSVRTYQYTFSIRTVMSHLCRYSSCLDSCRRAFPMLASLSLYYFIFLLWSCLCCLFHTKQRDYILDSVDFSCTIVIQSLPCFAVQLEARGHLKSSKNVDC